MTCSIYGRSSLKHIWYRQLHQYRSLTTNQMLILYDCNPFPTLFFFCSRNVVQKEHFFFWLVYYLVSGWTNQYRRFFVFLKKIILYLTVYSYQRKTPFILLFTVIARILPFFLLFTVAFNFCDILFFSFFGIFFFTNFLGF